LLRHHTFINFSGVSHPLNYDMQNTRSPIRNHHYEHHQSMMTSSDGDEYIRNKKDFTGCTNSNYLGSQGTQRPVNNWGHSDHDGYHSYSVGNSSNPTNGSMNGYTRYHQMGHPLSNQHQEHQGTNDTCIMTMPSLVLGFHELTTASYAVFTLILSLFFLKSISKSKKNNDSSIAMAPAGIFETIAGQTSDDAPFWVLKMARILNKPNFRLNVPGTKFYIIGGYKLARRILQDNTTDKPREIYKKMQGSFSDTLFTSSKGEYQKSIRKSTAHAFSRNEVARMNDVATKYVDEWMNSTLQKYAETSEIFNPGYEFNAITFKIICEAAFEYDGSEKDFRDFEHHAEIVNREFCVKSIANPLRRPFGYFIPSYRKAVCSSEILLEFYGRVLEVYRKNPNKSNNNTLIKILEANKSIQDDRQRCSEIGVWLTGGHDTTGYQLASITTLLAKHPAVQTKLREELLKTTTGKLEGCEYFQYVVKEGMRFMPVAAFGGGRITGREYKLDDGTVLPKGSVCFMNQFVANRNEDIYKDADYFIPERWMCPTQEMKDAFSFMPFMAGPRSCPGQALAMAEINSILPKLIKEYSLELVDEGKPDYFLTFKYTGTKLRAKKISN